VELTINQTNARLSLDRISLGASVQFADSLIERGHADTQLMSAQAVENSLPIALQHKFLFDLKAGLGLVPDIGVRA
jgi:hypothetical protein